MIKKRYLVVMSLAVVSALLGGLLYTALGSTSAGKPEPQPSICKDSVEIELLDWSMRDKYYPLGDDHLEQGIVCVGPPYTIPLVLPFAFNPREKFVNVTDFWFSFVMADESGYTGYIGKVFFNITINEDNTVSSESSINAGHIHTISVHLNNPDILNTISPNINTLSLTHDHVEIYNIPQQNWRKMWVYRVTVLIEYEYQA